MRKVYGSDKIRQEAGAAKVVKQVSKDVVDSVVKTLELEGVIDRVKEAISTPRNSQPSSPVTTGMMKRDSRKWEEDLDEAAAKNDVSPGPSTSSRTPATPRKKIRNVRSLSEVIDVSKQIMEEIMDEMERTVDTAFPAINVLIEKVTSA